MWTSDAAYDSFMGRFSRRLAPVFADFAGVQKGDRALDVGAGTGALTEELLRRGAKAAAAEPAPAFAASLRRRFPDLDVREAPAEELPWEDGSFDVALAQLVVAFMDDAPAGVAEMARVAGGRVAVCMWDLERQQLLASANHVRERMGEKPREPPRYRTAPELQELLGPGAEVTALDVVADYADFEDYWEALLGGAGPLGEWAASLDDARRETARTELIRELGDPSGPFTLTGRCWAARVRSD
ncbi:MAG TPA: class I SAM-dependent methyltransferase [Gaiellaceae bacterium]|nr:class I SAM-dependent methyltransferase [Gaiellaceae bacterium]